MYKLFLTFIAFITYTQISATSFIVGTGYLYTSPNALYNAGVVNHGDTILIQAATYSGVQSLANWNKNNLIIKGINGRPHLRAAGQNIGGKSIWITSGDNIHIENIEFSECSVPDENGAGIRAEAPNLSVKSCYFHHNENGILTNNPFTGTMTIEHCEFAYNGFGDGISHNVYIGHIQKLIFRYNYSHHANVGHNLKSRASENIIIANRIMDENTGNSSRIIDLSNGGFALILGNVFMQGPNAINNNMVGYGLEGLSNPIKKLFVINNTFVNKRATCIFVSIASGTDTAQVINNIFTGNGTIISGTTTSNINNTIESNINNMHFFNEANFDYHLTSSSPGINTGSSLGFTGTYNLIPQVEYLHLSNYVHKVFNAQIDPGAYEFVQTCNNSFTQYIFTGSFNNQWNNTANWDNGCLPPTIYNGTININEDCVTQQNFNLRLLLNGSIIIHNNKKLFIYLD
jgi:hypothetical protein